MAQPDNLTVMTAAMNFNASTSFNRWLKDADIDDPWQAYLRDIERGKGNNHTRSTHDQIIDAISKHNSGHINLIGNEALPVNHSLSHPDRIARLILLWYTKQSRPGRHFDRAYNLQSTVYGQLYRLYKFLNGKQAPSKAPKVKSRAPVPSPSSTPTAPLEEESATTAFGTDFHLVVLWGNKSTSSVFKQGSAKAAIDWAYMLEFLETSFSLAEGKVTLQHLQYNTNQGSFYAADQESWEEVFAAALATAPTLALVLFLATREVPQIVVGSSNVEETEEMCAARMNPGFSQARNVISKVLAKYPDIFTGVHSVEDGALDSGSDQAQFAAEVCVQNQHQRETAR